MARGLAHGSNIGNLAVLGLEPMTTLLLVLDLNHISVLGLDLVKNVWTVRA